MRLNCGAGEDSWEGLGLHGDPTSPSQRRSVLNIHRKDWCWSWNSNTLATWCEELTHWKRPWCWETLRAGAERGDRGSDGWMTAPTWWIWVWANSRSWWWTRKPDVLQSMGSQSQSRLSNWTNCLIMGKCIFFVLIYSVLYQYTCSIETSYSLQNFQSRNGTNTEVNLLYLDKLVILYRINACMDYKKRKRNAKDIMVVWGGLTNSWEKKRS